MLLCSTHVISGLGGLCISANNILYYIQNVVKYLSYSLHLSLICPIFQSFILSPIFLAISFIHSSICLLFHSSFTSTIDHSFIHLSVHPSSLNSFIGISTHSFFRQLLKSFTSSHIILFVLSFINILPLFISLLCFSIFLSVNSRITFHLGF